MIFLGDDHFKPDWAGVRQKSRSRLGRGHL
jgi:hypothetical protein